MSTEILTAMLGIVSTVLGIMYLRTQGRIDTQRQKYDAQLQAIRNEAAEMQANEATRQSLISLTRDTMQQNSQSNNRLADAIDKLTTHSQTNNDKLEDAIIDLTKVMAKNGNLLGDLSLEVRTTRAVTEATQTTVIDTSKVSQTNMELLIASVNSMSDEIKTMRASLLESLASIDTSIREGQEKLQSDHVRMFNQVQLIKDIETAVGQVHKKLEDLQQIQVTPTPETQEASTDDNITNEEAA